VRCGGADGEGVRGFRCVGPGRAGATDPGWLADHLMLLSKGAITTSAISGSPEPAERAREAAVLLMNATLPA
jgi:hypothetical protein